MDIINRLSARAAKDWVKLCDIIPPSNALNNKKLLLKEISLAISGERLLPAVLVEKVAQKLNDSAITTELYNFSRVAKANAKSRKNQLQNHLLRNFTSLGAQSDAQKSLSFISKKQLKRIQRSVHNKTRTKSSPTAANTSSAAPTFNKDLNSKPSETMHLAEPKISHSPLSAPSRDNVELPVEPPQIAVTKPKKTKNEKKADKSAKSADKPPNKNASNEEVNLFEVSMKTLESTILQLQDSSTRHENAINNLNTSEEGDPATPTCGLTKIEATLIEERTTKLEKKLSTATKQLDSHSKALSQVSSLQDTCNCLKDELSEANEACRS